MLFRSRREIPLDQGEDRTGWKLFRRRAAEQSVSKTRGENDARREHRQPLDSRGCQTRCRCANIQLQSMQPLCRYVDGNCSRNQRHQKSETVDACNITDLNQRRPAVLSMANKVPGIVNGAMAFNEQTLMPLYKLIIGKPGSSYTFSIAETIGLSPVLINKARGLVSEDHFSLDKLLNRTEQDLREIEKKEQELNRLVKENERLKKEMMQVMNKERHLQEVEVLKHQNQVSEERISYLKDMERKLKQIVLEWRKAEDKTEPMKQMHNLLHKKKDEIVKSKLAKKVESQYEETATDIVVGARVKLKKNYQIGFVKEIRGKRAIVQVGQLPMNVELADLVVVEEKNS